MHADHKLWLDRVWIVGTPGYMAPELVAAVLFMEGGGNMHYTFDAVAADWWSVGAVLFVAAVGTRLITSYEPDTAQTHPINGTANLSSHQEPEFIKEQATFILKQHQKWQVHLWQVCVRMMHCLCSTCLG